MATQEGDSQSTTSQSQRFFSYFQLEATALQEQMAKLKELPAIGGERMDAMEHCLAGISRLRKEVQDASSYISTYDQKVYAEGIKALHAKLEETKAAVAPKPKFSFKSKAGTSGMKKNDSAISLNDAAELAMQQRAKLLKGKGETSGYSSESSSVATPAETAKASAASKENPEAQTGSRDISARRGSLGEFLKAAGVSSSEKAKHGDEGTQVTAAGAVSKGSSSGIRKMSFAQENAVVLDSHSSQHIILPSSAARATTSTGSLTNVRRCIVDMSIPTASVNILPTLSDESAVAESPVDDKPRSPVSSTPMSSTAAGRPFAGLTIRDVSQSLLICGNVEGAAHITSVEDSVIVVAAKQLRMHTCHRCVVYLHVGSKPIVEDCDNMQFAKLPEFYLKLSKKTAAENQWDQVQDFNWHREEHSPNWSVLDDKDAVPGEVWKRIAAGDPKWSLDDTLEAAGIAGLQKLKP